MNGVAAAELYAAIASLRECQNVSLLGVSRILSDRNYRRSIVKRVTDPGLKLFWQNEFERYDERFLREAIAPVQNKVGQLLLAPHVRHIFGQVTSRINIRFIMDNRRIFIADLTAPADRDNRVRDEQLDTTKPTKGRAVDALVDAGVLVETTRRQRDRAWASQRYLDGLRMGTELDER